MGWLALSIFGSAVAAADGVGDARIPVLMESPPCPHERLGTIEVETGRKVSELTDDDRLPVTRVAPALARLGEAAADRGATAVVLRGHQGVYFTHNGRRSAGPVYIKLHGALIRLPADTGECRLVFVDPEELERRMRSRPPDQTSARNAYAY